MVLGDEFRFADAAGFAAHEDPLSAARFVSPSPFQIFVDRFAIRILPGRVSRYRSQRNPHCE